MDWVWWRITLSLRPQMWNLFSSHAREVPVMTNQKILLEFLQCFCYEKSKSVIARMTSRRLLIQTFDDVYDNDVYASHGELQLLSKD